MTCASLSPATSGWSVKARRAESSPLAVVNPCTDLDRISWPGFSRAMNSGKTAAKSEDMRRTHQSQNRALNLGIRSALKPQPQFLEKTMQLSSRFASRSPMLRTDHPLSDDQIRAVAPSIFAEDKHESRSDRYRYIDEKCGFVRTTQGRIPAFHGVPNARARLCWPRASTPGHSRCGERSMESQRNHSAETRRHQQLSNGMAGGSDSSVKMVWCVAIPWPICAFHTKAMWSLTGSKGRYWTVSIWCGERRDEMCAITL